MFSSATIKQGLYDWVTSQATEVVIWMNPNAPRPPVPYIALDMGDAMLLGWDYQTEPDANGDASLFGNREFEMEVHYYGDGGRDVMEKLKTSLQQFDVICQLQESGLHFVDRMAEVSDTTLLDTLWEERRILELRFRTSNQGVTAPSKYQVGYIETADVQGSYDDHD